MSMNLTDSQPYETLCLYIDGEFVQGGGRHEQDVVDPATGELLGRLPHATPADLDRALAAAARAFETWQHVSPMEKSRVLRRVGELTRERAREVGRNMTRDQGKPLADAVALYFTVPLFVTALAGPMLGERNHWVVWASVLLGFVGVMVMLQPGTGLFEPAALLSLLAAALYGLAMLLARRHGADLSAAVMGFYQNGFFLLGSGLAAAVLAALGIDHAVHPSLQFVVRAWTVPNAYDACLIGLCGVVASAGIMLLTNAYRVARASTVTPFEYTGILWAPLWGFLFFGEVPRHTTVIGALIIVVAGLMALRLARRDAE